MKVNKWTLGLAAAGLVSLPAVVQADERPSPIMSALASTTISGYVNTSAQWDIGNGTRNAPGYAFNGGKQDGFNLNVVKVALEKPLDEAEWSAGYKAELLYGPDANALGTASTGIGTGTDFAIKQAYVAMRVPVGNDLDLKMGVFDTIIGYEGFDAGSNPNFSRSWAYTIEPTTHTGLLGTYRVAEWLSVAAGVANTHGPVINARSTIWATTPTGASAVDVSQSQKTVLGSVALTAPEDTGFLAGSTLYGGVVHGFNTDSGTVGQRQTSLYAGATMNTPVTNLKIGAALDYVFGDSIGYTGAGTWYAWAAGGYLSYQATEKLSFHGRGEYAAHSEFAGPYAGAPGFPDKVFSATGTVQYDLWKNVLSRLEFRWDHAANGTDSFGGTVEGGGAPTLRNAYTVMANVIYNF